MSKAFASVAAAFAACTLLAACGGPPPSPPPLSGAEIDTVAAQCGVGASTITVDGDKLRFDPAPQTSATARACVLKELRERLPGTSVESPVKIKGQTEHEDGGHA